MDMKDEMTGGAEGERSSGAPAGGARGLLRLLMSGDRRQFLQLFTFGVGAIGALVVAAPAVVYVLAPLFKRIEHKWRDVGPMDKFAVGDTVLVSFEDAWARPWAGRTAKTGSWLRRTGASEFIAFSLNCTHLGCPIRWEPGAELFMCPCHGGVYYSDGRVAAGPPPQPLHRYPVRVREGRVEIKTMPLPIT